MPKDNSGFTMFEMVYPVSISKEEMLSLVNYYHNHLDIKCGIKAKKCAGDQREFTSDDLLAHCMYELEEWKEAMFGLNNMTLAICHLTFAQAMLFVAGKFTLMEISEHNSGWIPSV
jgi:hypothetical protein